MRRIVTETNEPQYTEAQHEANKINYLDMLEARLDVKERIAFMGKRDEHFTKTGELLSWKAPK